MAITGETINSKLIELLQDQTNIRWTKGEICGWINSAQREILLHKPNANPVAGAIDLAIGTKQQLPTNGIQLLDITKNLGTTAVPVDGKVITNIDRKILDRVSTWHSSANRVTAAVGVDHYAFDPRFPTIFYVYPGLSEAAKAEGVYSSMPTDLGYVSGTTWNGGANTTGAIFNDLYETPIIDYCAYRCYAKDADYTGNDGKSVAYYQAFMAGITGKSKAELALAPISHLAQAQA